MGWRLFAFVAAPNHHHMTPLAAFVHGAAAAREPVNEPLLFCNVGAEPLLACDRGFEKRPTPSRASYERLDKARIGDAQMSEG